MARFQFRPSAQLFAVWGTASAAHAAHICCEPKRRAAGVCRAEAGGSAGLQLGEWDCVYASEVSCSNSVGVCQAETLGIAGLQLGEWDCVYASEIPCSNSVGVCQAETLGIAGADCMVVLVFCHSHSRVITQARVKSELAL